MLAPHLDTHLNLQALQNLLPHLQQNLKAWLLDARIEVRELILTVKPEGIQPVLTFLKNNDACQFTQLIDICGVDYLGHTPAHPQRFAVAYHLLSLSLNQRIRVKAYLNEGESIPTISTIYPAANWYERETYDMYGIPFEGHPDLRRLLTDYDFEGFPLRKDFPLEGHVEVYYDAEQKRVAYKPVDLPQEFRHFDDVNQWSGADKNAHLADANNTFNREDFK